MNKLSEIILSKCPNCKGEASHWISHNFRWVCGCKKCDVNKSDSSHERAIQKWEEYCKFRNNIEING